MHHTGIAIVKNSPVEKNSGLNVLNRISHTRETFFKTPFEVINIPKPNNSAYTAHALRNHMDLPWFETCLLYTSPSPRDKRQSRMPSSA